MTVERHSGRCPCGISSCVSWIPNNRQITFRGNYNRNIEKLQTRATSPNRSTTSYLLKSQKSSQKIRKSNTCTQAAHVDDLGHWELKSKKTKMARAERNGEGMVGFFSRFFIYFARLVAIIGGSNSKNCRRYLFKKC